MNKIGFLILIGLALAPTAQASAQSDFTCGSYRTYLVRHDSTPGQVSVFGPGVAAQYVVLIPKQSSIYTLNNNGTGPAAIQFIENSTEQPGKLILFGEEETCKAISTSEKITDGGILEPK